jgi:hypothetical protein
VANALLLGGRALSVESVSVHMNWRVMIKIRYVDPNKISPGLHAAVECHGRSTTVYLLCGLRPQQRQAAFRRLRMSARMGYCPALPAPQLAFARFKDRIRTGLGQAGAVVRSHPAASTVPFMLVSAGAIGFLLLAAVSTGAHPGPRTGPLAAAPRSAQAEGAGGGGGVEGTGASANAAQVPRAPAGPVEAGPASAGTVPAGTVPASPAPAGAGPSAGLPPLPGGLMPAAREGPDTQLLAPAPRESIGVAAFTSEVVSPRRMAAGSTLTRTRSRTRTGSESGGSLSAAPAAQAPRPSPSAP